VTVHSVASVSSVASVRSLVSVGCLLWLRSDLFDGALDASVSNLCVVDLSIELKALHFAFFISWQICLSPYSSVCRKFFLFRFSLIVNTVMV
jgi:hypothetical protein